MTKAQLYGRPELFEPRLLCQDGGVQIFLLGVVVTGENPELLVVDAPQYVVLVEPFEERRQFRVPAPHGVQFFLHRVDSAPQLQAVLLIDVLCEQPLFLPGEVR